MSVSLPTPRFLAGRTCATPRMPISRRPTRPDRRRDAACAVDVRSALVRALAQVPALEGRVTVICEDVSAWVETAVVEEVATRLLHLAAAIPDHRMVWISAVPAAGGVVLTVEDDADWVADDPALRRGRPATSAALQLARVGQLARAHGGACWVEPAADRGMRFVVDLPGVVVDLPGRLP